MTDQFVQDRFKVQPHHRVRTPTRGHTFFTILITLMTILLAGPAVFATPLLQIEGSGQLTGASGVNVGGTLYDVKFVDGTCIGIFNGCNSENDFFFQNAASAILAAQALLDEVFLDTILGNFDTSPFLTLGCELVASSKNVCRPSTPYKKRGPNLRARDASNDEEELKDKARLERYTESEDFGTQENHVWAYWTEYNTVPNGPGPAPVPEPTTMVLLVTGLFGLIGYQWRQRRAERLYVG